jgi:hypothetical protein
VKIGSSFVQVVLSLLGIRAEVSARYFTNWQGKDELCGTGELSNDFLYEPTNS